MDRSLPNNSRPNKPTNNITTKQTQRAPIHPQTKATLQPSQPPQRTTIPTTTPRDPIHTIHPHITIRQFKQHKHKRRPQPQQPHNHPQGPNHANLDGDSVTQFHNKHVHLRP